MIKFDAEINTSDQKLHNAEIIISEDTRRGSSDSRIHRRGCPARAGAEPAPGWRLASTITTSGAMCRPEAADVLV